MEFPVPERIHYDDGERQLTLRPARMEDVDALLAAIDESMTELRAFMPWAHAPQTRMSQRARLAEVEAGYQTGGDRIFHAYAGDSDRLLGCFGLHDRTLNTARAAEIGFWVRTSAARRGVATLATQMLTWLAFEHYDCERVQCAYNERNNASRRVNEKVGFKVEGRLRYFEYQGDETLRRNGYQVGPDTVMAALIPAEFAELPWREGFERHVRADFIV